LVYTGFARGAAFVVARHVVLGLLARSLAQAFNLDITAFSLDQDN
jgi:hypothetical protein